MYHLHIVEQSTWTKRNERIMRDYLLAHPEAVSAYVDLKERLAKELAVDSLAYTRAKTPSSPNEQGARRDRIAARRCPDGLNRD